MIAYFARRSKMKTGLAGALPLFAALPGRRCALLLCAALALAGCATKGPQGLSLNDLRTSDYVRTERHIPYKTFAEVQMALFKHQRACGGDITFTADPSHASYAIVSEKDFPGAGWDHTLVIQLVLLLDHPMQATAYSYYAGTGQRFDRMFSAIIKPGVCGDKPAAKPPAARR